MAKPKITDVSPAYAWDCDNCGRENFTRLVVRENTEDRDAFIREELELEPWEELPVESDCLVLMGRPEIVECVYCNQVFDFLPDEEEDDQEYYDND